MDLFWSGLARRAFEHTWNEMRSQFSNVHETASASCENTIYMPNHSEHVCFVILIDFLTSNK